MAIMDKSGQSLPLYWAILTGFYQEWPLLSWFIMAIMDIIGKTEAPGALNTRLLAVY